MCAVSNTGSLIRTKHKRIETKTDIYGSGRQNENLWCIFRLQMQSALWNPSNANVVVIVWQMPGSCIREKIPQITNKKQIRQALMGEQIINLFR